MHLCLNCLSCFDWFFINFCFFAFCCFIYCIIILFFISFYFHYFIITSLFYFVVFLLFYAVILFYFIISRQTQNYLSISCLNILRVIRHVCITGELLANFFSLVLEQKVLSESEAKKISQKYNTPLEKFPRILKSDPSLKNMKEELKAGQLIEIKRNDNGKKYLYYRFVIEA